jgi:TonB-dependent starch-binding outer membrane protein SusC
MSWRRTSALLFALLLMPMVLHAQESTATVAGVVTASDTKAPLPGVNVFVVGTSRSAISGADGRYVITGVTPGSRVVRAVSIGQAAQERTISAAAGQTTIANFELVAEAVALREIVAVGYGTTTRRETTGAVSTVTTEALERAPIQSVDQMLAGTAPGVQVTTGSSEPGGALSVRIRGTSSITGNSEPLYVIDGFPIENDITGASVGNGGRDRTTPPNPLITLNPSDIESISILKDASATAIYGARGANGVVIVTTKQGRGTKPNFTIDYFTGTQSVAKRYDLLNATEFMDYANTFVVNGATNRPDTLTAGQRDAISPFPTTLYGDIVASGVNTDWQDQIFRDAGVQNLQLSVRGAAGSNSTTRYALSGGFYDQDGVVVGSGFRRFSGRLNLNQSLGQRFELGGTFTASQARSKSVPTAGQQNAGAGAVSGALQYVPILPVRREDGSYTLNNPDVTALVGSNILDAAPVPNPVSMTEVRDSLSDTRLLGNMFMRADIIPGLEGRVSFGADYANRSRQTYYPRTTLRGALANGEAIRGLSTTLSWLNENTLTYRREINKIHNLTVLGGYSQQHQDVDGETMNNTNFVNDITGYFDIGAGTQEGGPQISSRRSAQTLLSWLGRVNYSLLDRYLFTATYRADGSSRFAAEKKWGSFPSLAVAWRASEESFLKPYAETVNDLKLRASWGEVGNPSIRAYESLARLNDQSYSFGGTPVAGYYPIAVGNPNLTWETTEQVDLGFDFAFLNRFNLVFDWYRKETRDLLLRIDLPMETGFESALANRGSVENRGVELGLEARVLGDGSSRDALGWRANLNFARNSNKVLDLGGPQTLSAELLTTDFNLPGTLIQVGKPIGRFYGFKSLGIVRDSTQAASITHTNFTSGRYTPGDVLIADICCERDEAGNILLDENGLPIMGPDGLTTLEDRTDIGDPTPDFTLGLTNTITYRSFELSSLIQGSFGGEILNVNRIRTESSPRVNISRERVVNAWSPENPDGRYPQIGENPNQVGPNNFTSDLLEDGSYIRLRTVTLSFLMPESLQSRLRLSASRVYVTGTNLFTITDYSGFDPDVSAQSVGNTNRGIDIGAYPLARSVTVGVSFNF